MVILEVFDKPMCCSTGVCGPEVDQALIHFAADLRWLEENGVQVTRVNPASQPDLLASNQVVREELRKSGGTCLPLLLINHQVATVGKYPSRAHLASLIGIPLQKLDLTGETPGSCCGSPKANGGQSSPCCS